MKDLLRELLRSVGPDPGLYDGRQKVLHARMLDRLTRAERAQAKLSALERFGVEDWAHFEDAMAYIAEKADK